MAIHIPSEQEEAVRDLCRTRARHRLSKFLLRHGHVWRGGGAWTLAHERWLGGQHFAEPALAATYAHYRGVLASRDAQLAAVETDLAGWLEQPPFAVQVARLAAYRGVTHLGALTLALAAEVCDWRRFARASQFMGVLAAVLADVVIGQPVDVLVRAPRGEQSLAGVVGKQASALDPAACGCG